jgi:glycerophosphoryl diester phosphodiesterase
MLICSLVIHLLLIFVFNICQRLDRPLVIGHRGSAYLPELTLETQSIAYAYGADMIEIDICLTRDNQLVVLHGKK